MSSIVVDTHAFIWYLLTPTRLSRAARDALVQASAHGDPIYVPAITLVEICYLVDKGKWRPKDLDALVTAIADPNRADS